MKTLAFLILLFSMTGLGIAEVSPSNWGGRYAPCSRHADLEAHQHLDLGVRISTSNPLLAQQFEKAMEFWAGVLDLDWHQVDSQDCAIQLVDGTPALFDFCTCMSARSQIPGRPAFQGWIAFNPRMPLTKQQMFLDSVHEIGHLLGLPHNPSDSSVMFHFGVDKIPSLDATDLGILATRHQLRPRILSPKGGMKEIRVIEPKQAGAHDPGWFQAMAWRMRHFPLWSNTSSVASVSTPGRFPAE